MSAEGKSVLGADFDALVQCEKQRLADAAAKRAEEKASYKERFRTVVANALARLSNDKDAGASVHVYYPYNVDVGDFIDELVSRGHYVVNWRWAGACYPADAGLPNNYLEVFAIGTRQAGSDHRMQLGSIFCQLL